MPFELNIPLVEGEPLPNFEAQYVLEAVTYTLRFRWNDRLGAWFMAILDADAETVRSQGIRVVINWPLNGYRSGKPLPGQLMAFDSTGQDLDPQLNDLGTRVKIYYFTVAEIAAGLVTARG